MPYYDERRQQWRGQVKLDGKKHYAQFPSKKAAIAWEVSFKKQQQALGHYPPSLTLVDFATRWLTEVQMRYQVITFRIHRLACQYLVGTLGNMPVDRINSQMLGDHFLLQRKQRSAVSVNKDRACLASMWEWGVEHLGLENNPVRRVKSFPHAQRPPYIPSTADVEAILRVAKPKDKVMLLCFLNTGARRSEILRWRWDEDINLERKEVRLGTRKTRDGSMRHDWMPMTESLFNALTWWRTQRTGEHVFMSIHGEPFKTRDEFMPSLCKRAGVKPFGFHSLRRYVASLMADEHNVSTKAIQRVLRHEQIKTTELYLHNINRDLRGTMAVLDKGLPWSLPSDDFFGNGA